MILGLSVVLILLKGDKAVNTFTNEARKTDIQECTRNWCTLVFILLTLRVFAELMMVDIIGNNNGCCRNNIVLFMIKCVLVGALVYPWREWYIELGSWDLDKPKHKVAVSRSDHHSSHHSSSHHSHHSSSSSHSDHHNTA